MNLIFSHPTGNTNVRAAALGFLRKKMLFSFNTAIASFPGGILDRIGGVKPFNEIRRRNFDPGLEPFTKTWPWLEIGRLTAGRLGLNSLTKHESGFFSVDSVYKYQDRMVAKLIDKRVDLDSAAIYAFEDGAACSFKTAKKNGIKCIYDLPIGYWRAARNYLKDEKKANPEWAVTMTGFRDTREKLIRKDEEIKNADLIIVASNFTAESLKLFPGKLPPVKIIPYGFPEVGEAKKYDDLRNRPLKILFVGGLSQRKGISYLFNAVEGMGNKVELILVGRKPVTDCKILNEHLTRHTWLPSLSHNEILKLMRQCDVLLFPSLFEGFGLVITEAMSQGTPVITTSRTIGPDIIKHNRNGWIVEAGSSESIKEILLKIIAEPYLLSEVGSNALETAKRRSWIDYGNDLASAVRENFRFEK